jgi:hypothetical protein
MHDKDLRTMKENTPVPTPYPELNAVLQELVESMQTVLSSNFVAACLQGSFAVGDFDEHSDVDFIVAIEQELSDEHVQALNAMHDRIYNLDCAWAQHLEGSYFPGDVLKDASQSGSPVWYLDHGSRSLERSNHCNTVLVRWVVREYGVALTGLNPKSLVNAIPVATLRREIAEVISGWGWELLTDPEPYNNRFYQAFIVLNYCRMLHDLCNGFPGSKRSGAEWAKTTLDPSWADLIDRSWDGRPNPAVSVRQRADPQDFKRTLEFVRYIIELSTQAMASLETDETLSASTIIFDKEKKQ